MLKKKKNSAINICNTLNNKNILQLTLFNYNKFNLIYISLFFTSCNALFFAEFQEPNRIYTNENYMCDKQHLYFNKVYMYIYVDQLTDIIY